MDDGASFRDGFVVPRRREKEEGPPRRPHSRRHFRARVGPPSLPPRSGRSPTGLLYYYVGYSRRVWAGGRDAPLRSIVPACVRPERITLYVDRIIRNRIAQKLVCDKNP